MHEHPIVGGSRDGETVTRCECDRFTETGEGAMVKLVVSPETGETWKWSDGAFRLCHWTFDLANGIVWAGDGAPAGTMRES